MADSTDKNTQGKKDKLADDLDSMLDDAASSLNEPDDLMNDDDAIDKLLMDNAFEPDKSQDEFDEFDDFDDLFVDDNSTDNPTEDEKIESPESTESTEVLLEKEVAQSLANSGNASNLTDNDEKGEFAEISEFDDEPVRENVSVPETTSDTGDDFTLAEFDISDDEFAESETEEAIADGKAEEIAEGVEGSSAAPVTDAAIVATIKQLMDEQTVLKQQVADLSEPADSSEGLRNEMSQLQQAQQALKKQVDNVSGHKVQVIIYIAIGMAVLALILAAASLFTGLGTSSDLEQVTESLATLEENQDALVIKNNDQELNAINETVAALTAKVTELISPVTADENQEEGSAPQVTLPGLREELAASKSEQAKLNTAMIALTDRIKSLEKNKTVARPVSKPIQKRSKSKAPKVVRKPVKKTVSSNTRWAVNLVSFRQDWYAKRKAAEYSKQGVPVLVDEVQVKGETWFRLTVPGFKSKSEAAAYAERVKRTFNLDSVWLGKN